MFHARVEDVLGNISPGGRIRERVGQRQLEESALGRQRRTKLMSYVGGKALLARRPRELIQLVRWRNLERGVTGQRGPATLGRRESSSARHGVVGARLTLVARVAHGRLRRLPAWGGTYCWKALAAAWTCGGCVSSPGGLVIWPVLVGSGKVDPVGAHAPREPQQVRRALVLALSGRLGWGWEQVLAGGLGRVQLRAADPELLRGLLNQVAATVGVGGSRHVVGAHAVGEGKRSDLRRRCRGIGGGGAGRGCGRAELRHVTARRSATCRRRKSQTGRSDGGAHDPSCGRPGPPSPAYVAGLPVHWPGREMGVGVVVHHVLRALLLEGSSRSCAEPEDVACSS